jgi:hypothetical protein
MHQKIKYAVDSMGRRRVQTIFDYDRTSRHDSPKLMWVFTAPSYDPVYHMRRKGDSFALCTTDILYCEPSFAYTATDTPKIYCGHCWQVGFYEAMMEQLAE